MVDHYGTLREAVTAHAAYRGCLFRTVLVKIIITSVSHVLVGNDASRGFVASSFASMNSHGELYCYDIDI